MQQDIIMSFLVYESLLKVKLLIVLVKDLTDQCFHNGFTFKELIALLLNHQDIKVSIPTLHS